MSLHVWQEDGSMAAGLLPSPAQPGAAWCCLVWGNPRHAEAETAGRGGDTDILMC